MQIHMVTILFALVLCLQHICIIQSFRAGNSKPNWGYNTQVGPADWRSKYPECNGQKQSPIDFNGQQRCGNAAHDNKHLPLMLQGSCSTAIVAKHGKGFQWKLINSTCVASVGGNKYLMKQFHMHTPSEHTINGKQQDGEVHFVHKMKNDKKYLVIGLFFTASANTENKWLTKVLKSFEVNRKRSIGIQRYIRSLVKKSVQNKELKMRIGEPYTNLFSKATPWYNYEGSFTTPPCTEAVDWWVVKSPIPISKAQLRLLNAYLNRKNARPTNSLNGRTITEYSSSCKVNRLLDLLRSYEEDEEEYGIKQNFKNEMDYDDSSLNESDS